MNTKPNKYQPEYYTKIPEYSFKLSEAYVASYMALKLAIESISVAIDHIDDSPELAKRQLITTLKNIQP